MFAKLYGEDEDQILVLLQETEEGDGYEVAFMFQPPGQRLSAVRLAYTPNEDGSMDDAYMAAKGGFDKVDEMMAMRVVSNGLRELGYTLGGESA